MRTGSPAGRAEKMMAMIDSPLKKGQLVLAQGRTGTFRVLEVSKDGRTADIESSIPSKQGQLGPVLMAIPCTALAALTDDTSVAAAPEFIKPTANSGSC